MQKLLYIAVIAVSVSTVAAEVPLAANQYKSLLIRTARMEMGLNAPIALFAAQIHQESAWRPEAQSAYAGGLTQFTPPTADWAAMRWSDLEPAQVFSPAWAIRAMIRYNTFLYKRVPFSAKCDRWAGTLASYNGGNGNLRKDIRLSGNLDYWWNGVENFSNRAEWAFKENRDYPRKIIFKHQPLYISWGNVKVCLN